MADSTARLRTLLREELGECHDADVERRVDELQVLAESAFGEDPVRPIFAALGDGTRYRLARALTVADGELCVCELESLVEVSGSAVSHALSDLVEAGLATRRKDGSWRYYTTTPLAETLFDTAETEVRDA